LNATSALGVFAHVKCGASLRPPLQWSNNISHVAFTHPYILTLNDEFVTVHRSVSSSERGIPVDDAGVGCDTDL